MTWLRVLGLLLLVAGVIYAVLYARWLRRRSGHLQGAAGPASDDPGLVIAGPASDDPGLVTAGLFSGDTGLVTDTVTKPDTGPPAGPPAGNPANPIDPLLPEEALILARVEGTYLTTTVALSRQERVVADGLGTSGPATVVVDEKVVRWDRRGASEVRVAGHQLVGVRLGPSVAGRLPRRPQPVLVSWTGDRVHSDDPHKGADRYLTGFQPRSKSDSAVLVSAIQRLMQICGPNHSAPTTPNGNP